MRRSTTLLCARYWSDTLYSSEHLPAASRSRAPTSVLLLLHNALADAQHLLDLEARHRLLRRTRPSSSPRSQPRVVLASRGVLALRGRAAGTARALAHTGIPQRQPRERPESRGCHGKLRNLARFGLMTTELAGITFSFEAGFAQQTPGFSHSPRYTYGLCVCTRYQAGIRSSLRSGATRRTSTAPVHVAIGHVYRPPQFAIVEFCYGIFS